MFTSKLFCGYRARLVTAYFTRNKGEKTAATDPVQQLFLDKLREYTSKKPEPSPAILKELKAEMDKLDKNYGGGKGVDMATFPAFQFQEPKLDPIDEAVPEKKEKKKKMVAVKKKAAPKKGPPAWIAPKNKKKK